MIFLTTVSITFPVTIRTRHAWLDKRFTETNMLETFIHCILIYIIYLCKLKFYFFRELCGVEPQSSKSYSPMRGNIPKKTWCAAVTLLTLCTR